MPTHDPVAIVTSLGGVARIRDVRELGVSKDAIRRAVVARRTLRRPRHGIVAIPGLPDPIFRAVTAGGALAALSAAEYYGLWTPPGPGLHVSVRADAARRPERGIAFVRDGERLRDDERFIVSLPTCVRQCIRLLPHDEAVAVVDSALHVGSTGGGRPLDLPRLRLELPRRFHPVIDAADGRAESGAETLARVRLARIGIVARPQVWVTQTIRVDLLIHDRLIVEIGSKEFHADPGQYEGDHARAATLLALGCDVLEFTTSQIMDDWDVVEGIIAEHAERASRQ